MRVKKLITLTNLEVKEALRIYVEEKHKIKITDEYSLHFLNGNRESLELFDKVNCVWFDETVPKKKGLSMWDKEFNWW